ncbi:hypothetical protein RDWZM_000012 [Blomia tropicalis]|uniref:Uncharacterized protein n=1 Tax=Blomia tropicalis TaxID=40697 RepID=A0A9Q0M9C5_BLOTA|nr:hypothetical protein RDWZM_000012 [Blomia tropicalis]
MAISTAALGLLTTAAILSMYRMPKLQLPSNSKNNMQTNYVEELYKRNTNLYIPQRQMYESPPPPPPPPIPPRFSLDRMMNQLFRRPYLADIPPARYRRRNRRPTLNRRAPPIWNSHPSRQISNTHFPKGLSNIYGMPMPPKSSMKPLIINWNKRIKNRSTKRPDATKVTFPNGPKDSNDRHSDEFDDIDEEYYYGDYDYVDQPPWLDEEENRLDQIDAFESDLSSITNKINGTSNGLKTNATKNSRKKKSAIKLITELVTKPSKNYIKEDKTKTSSTTQSTTTIKDCLPVTKVNYHYHMYMLNKKQTEQKNNNKDDKKTDTSIISSTYPIYEPKNVNSQIEIYQTLSPIEKAQIEPIKLESYSSKGSENSNLYYQMIPSSSYVDQPSSSFISSTNQKSETQQHFDTDYYNNVLLTKILEMNPNGNVVPVENYVTEGSEKESLIKFDKSYKNAKSIDASKLFQMDQNSNLYVPIGKTTEDVKTKVNCTNNDKKMKKDSKQ